MQRLLRKDRIVERGLDAEGKRHHDREGPKEYSAVLAHATRRGNTPSMNTKQRSAAVAITARAGLPSLAVNLRSVGNKVGLVPPACVDALRRSPDSKTISHG